jgi:hypothetical protein
LKVGQMRERIPLKRNDEKTVRVDMEGDYFDEEGGMCRCTSKLKLISEFN